PRRPAGAKAMLPTGSAFGAKENPATGRWLRRGSPPRVRAGGTRGGGAQGTRLRGPAFPMSRRKQRPPCPPFSNPNLRKRRPDSESIVDHVAGVEDYQVALATYRAACERWPARPITLRQGARVIEDNTIRALPLHTPSREGLWPRLLGR